MGGWLARAACFETDASKPEQEQESTRLPSKARRLAMAPGQAPTWCSLCRRGRQGGRRTEGRIPDSKIISLLPARQLLSAQYNPKGLSLTQSLPEVWNEVIRQDFSPGIKK